MTENFHDTTTDDACVCGPTSEPVKRDDGSVDWVITHHSLDGREQREDPPMNGPITELRERADRANDRPDPNPEPHPCSCGGRCPDCAGKPCCGTRGYCECDLIGEPSS